MPQQNSKVALILCGGDVSFSELPIVTSRSNAMIPINGRPVIGWILEDLCARGINEIILVLRFDNYRLLNYVQWAYAKRMEVHFAFVQSGGTILHSLLAGLSWVRPASGVHIILGDTLLRDVFPEHPDFVFVGDYVNPEDWCLVETNSEGHVSAYVDKKPNVKDGLMALAGVYSLADTALLRSAVVESIRVGGKEISSVLEKYARTRAISVMKAHEWYDFGHIHYFNLAKRKLLQSRYFNSLSIDPVLGMITKESERTDKLRDELAWYQALPLHLQLLCPRLVFGQDSNRVVITQEYYGYPNLAELYVFGEFGFSVWMNALTKLMAVHSLLKNVHGEVTEDDVVYMYQGKTFSRLAELTLVPYWTALLKRTNLKINGVSHLNVHQLEDAISRQVLKLARTVDGGIVHGDFCFSNILYDLNSQVARMVDPRGSFGKQKLYGDPRYDVAKLRHSVSGRYDFIMADLFTAEESGDGFVFDLPKSENYDAICKYFDELIVANGYKKEEIMFIEGLLFISMVPLHKENFKRQLAMFLNGIIILNEVIVK